MSEDSISALKRALKDAEIELEFDNKPIILCLEEYITDGTLTGSSRGRVKKISDEILQIIKNGERVED